MNKFENTQSIRDDNITKLYCSNHVLYLFVQKRTLFYWQTSCKLQNWQLAPRVTKGWSTRDENSQALAHESTREEIKSPRDITLVGSHLNYFVKVLFCDLKEGRIWLKQNICMRIRYVVCVKHMHYSLFQVKTLDLCDKLIEITTAWISLNFANFECRQ